MSARFLREARALPVREDEIELALAMADPTDAYTIGAFEMVTGRAVRPMVAIPTELEAALERLYGAGKSAQSQMIGDVETRVDELAFDADVQQLKDLASEAPVIRLVSLLITNALETRASDIHIEPFENRLIVRYRIDGVLHEVESPPKRLSAAVISRIKIMANLDIAERRLPQDGRIRLRIQGKEIDLRVSTVPTMHGESVVMRILDKGDVALDFRKLGFEDDTLKTFLDVLLQPHGILLVTGPDGLRQDDDALHGARPAEPARREDPHRRGPGRIPDVRHQPDPGEAADRPDVRQRAALDRAAGSGRHHDRRDPRPRDRADRRAVGADRPPRAVDRAHERRAVDGQPAARHGRRGLPADVDGDRHPRAAARAQAVPALQGVRTSRCRSSSSRCGCAGTRTTREITLWHAKGCSQCAQTGYMRPLCILEMMPMTDAVRSLVMKHANAAELRAEAIRGGMVTMYEDGLRKALAGVTTFEEVLRVTREN